MRDSFGRFRRVLGTVAVPALLFLVALAAPRPAVAQDCRVVEIETTPTSNLQMVIWLEDAAGNYVDTLFITSLTGSYGLGNRPGMMTFNSGWRWPYGRRTTTFPVWAHRHGMEWPLLVFQNLDDDNLSHPLGQSSTEEFYCRPLLEDEPAWDTQTCASIVYTDKGMLSDTEKSLYPPRTDLSIEQNVDNPDAETFAGLNPFDSVSRATPMGEAPFRFNWPIPEGFPEGDYVMWLEVNKEFDQNEFYNYPEPVGIPWSEYGVPYRGQPSIVYRVPFTIGQDAMVTSVTDYEGYGDPDGIDGNLRTPDNTITTGVDGSGASRLLLTVDGTDLYRVRLGARPTQDTSPPKAIEELAVIDANQGTVTATFPAPEDDAEDEPVTGYEIRYMAGVPITEDNFASAKLALVSVAPSAPGVQEYVRIPDLTPRTRYFIGIRAYDECANAAPLAVFEVVTDELEGGKVEWCFVATAAYGSVLEQDVDMLRRFRDRFLRTHATGEILVEGYYTFGPALARMIAPSNTLRRAARAGLAPIVEAIRKLSPVTALEAKGAHGPVLPGLP